MSTIEIDTEGQVGFDGLDPGIVADIQKFERVLARYLAEEIDEDVFKVFRLANGEPVLFPVSAASLSALVILVDRVSAGSVTIEDDVLDDADENIARLVLNHIVAEDAVRPCIGAATPAEGDGQPPL